MRKEQGMTFIGMLMTMVGVIVIGIIIMKVIPVYIQNFEVRSSISALQKLDHSQFSFDSESNISVLKTKLLNQFTINGVDLKPEQITIISKSAGTYQISVTYVVIKPLFGNLSLMFEFHETKGVTVGPK